MDPYQVLGVRHAASTAEIRAAYVRLARVHHPDFHTGAGAPDRATADRRMREINEAWEVLGDPSRRRALDRRSQSEPPDFVPFHDDDDPEDAWIVEPPPGTGAPPRALTMAPGLLVIGAVALFSLGMIGGSAVLLALALISMVAAGVLFVLVPVFAMALSSQRERTS